MNTTATHTVNRENYRIVAPKSTYQVGDCQQFLLEDYSVLLILRRLKIIEKCSFTTISTVTKLFKVLSHYLLLLNCYNYNMLQDLLVLEAGKKLPANMNTTATHTVNRENYRIVGHVVTCKVCKLKTDTTHIT